MFTSQAKSYFFWINQANCMLEKYYDFIQSQRLSGLLHKKVTLQHANNVHACFTENILDTRFIIFREFFFVLPNLQNLIALKTNIHFIATIS